MSRASITPPALAREEVWNQLVQSIDEVFGDITDSPVNDLRRIRETWLLSTDALTSIASGELFSDATLDNFSKDIVIQQVNLLGLPIAETGEVSQAQFDRFHRHIAQFWYSKGKPSFSDFLAYCLNCEFGVERLWTRDYMTFRPDGHPDITNDINPNQPWYPTTHVNVFYDRTAFTIDVPTFISFFYDVSNYILVVHAVISREYVPTNNGGLEIPHNGIGMAQVLVREQVMTNFGGAAGVFWPNIYTGLTYSDANQRGTLAAYFVAEPTWPGTRVNAVVTVEGGLADSGSQTWDESAWTNLSSWSGPSIGLISYEHTVVSLPSVQDIVLFATAQAVGTLTTEESHSDDNLTWTPWALVSGSEITARYFKVKWTVTGSSPYLQIAHTDFYTA